MRDDGCTLRKIRSKTAGMIEVVMRIHDILYWFVRNQPCHFSDHGKRTIFIKRRFDHRNIIAEVDREAVVGSAGDQPDAIRKLLRLCALAGCGGSLHCIRSGHGGNSNVRLSVVDRELHRVMSRAQSDRKSTRLKSSHRWISY